MEYRWIAQDKDGEIYMYQREPEPLTVSWFVNGWKKISRGRYNKKWQLSLINLETHDYKIEGGILMEVEKEKIFKGSELQFKCNNGEWCDCGSLMEYRIKPKTKVVRFRNYLDFAGNVNATEDAERCRSKFFVKWIGTWQEVEIPEQQEKWPSELVARIAKVNLEAAEWLRDNWDSEIIGDSRDSEHLSTLMVWYKTPQGDKYWRDIANQL